MSKSSLRISVVLLLLAFSKLSYGAFLIEPHLGYNLKGSADYKGTVTVPGVGSAAVGSFSDTYHGLQLGGRVGVQFTPGIMFGLDYNRSTYDIKETYADGSASNTDSYSRNEIGAFVGASLPMSLRLWFSYYITKQTATKTNAVSGVDKGDFNKGNSYEIGVGYAPLRFMSVNLLYRAMTYDDGEFATGGMYSISPEYKSKEIVLGVSFPITL